MHPFHLLFTLLGIVLVALTLPLLVELSILSVAATFPPRGLQLAPAADFRLAVIVPAHNEEILIAACVASIRKSSGLKVRTFVIAHNCSDATAANAAAAGAQVLELNEDSGGGKGTALHFGFTHALKAGADAVMVVDADSVVSPNLIPEAIAALAAGSQALQCRYIAANSASSRTRLMALALTGMNVLRPRGRSRLGLSCGIFGNGFALAASTVRSVPYLANSVVEDLEYHLHLLRAGIRVDFLDSAEVLGELPDNTAAASTQRARWEGGRMSMRRRFSAPLALEVLRLRLRFFEPLLDLLSLPLASEAGLLLLALLIPLKWLRFYAADGLAVLLLYVLCSALLDREPIQSLKALAAAPMYLLFKIAVIPAKWRASRKNATWVRTDRNEGPQP